VAAGNPERAAPNTERPALTPAQQAPERAPALPAQKPIAKRPASLPKPAGLAPTLDTAPIAGGSAAAPADVEAHGAARGQNSDDLAPAPANQEKKAGDATYHFPKRALKDVF
jgi:cytoskeletal protein RodZ